MHLLRAAAVCLGLFVDLCAGAPPVPGGSALDAKAGAAQLALRRLKAAVRTPLFIQQSAGVNTIDDVTLTATAVAIRPDAPGEVSFSPSLGSAGREVLREATDYLKSLHRGWPEGHRIEIAFSSAIAPDDTSAAGLAIATLLHSMIAGWEPENACVVIGNLQPDGTVQSVSSALARLTTAMRAGASRILLAEKNVPQAADCLVNDGIAGFSRAQIFSVKDFEEIPLMASAKLDPDVAAAIAAFTEARQPLLAGVDANALLKENDIQEDLRGVLEKWPNHVSARLLLGRAIGRYQTFSLAGSVEAIERIATALLKGVNSSRPHDVKNVAPEQIDGELATLRRAMERVDPKARPYVEQIIRYGEAAHAWHRQPRRSAAEAAALSATLTAAARLAQDERQKLAGALLL